MTFDLRNRASKPAKVPSVAANEPANTPSVARTAPPARSALKSPSVKPVIPESTSSGRVFWTEDEVLELCDGKSLVECSELQGWRHMVKATGLRF